MNEEADNPLGELIRYGIVGIVSNLAAYLLFLGVTHIGVGHKTSMTVIYVGAATLGFLGHKQWTFSRSGHWLRTGWRYAAAHSLGYLLNLGLLLTFVDYLGYPHQLVQAAAIFVVAGFLFLTFKFTVFALPQTPDAEAP